MLQERDAQLDELKFHLLRAQQVMKENENKHRSNVSFNIDDQVFLKLQSYRKKSLAHRYNEKLAPRYYEPYIIKKKVGSAAYELALDIEVEDDSCLVIEESIPYFMSCN